MTMSQGDKITQSRIKLQNPYAYLDDEGNFEVVFEKKRNSSEQEVFLSRTELQNPYAHLRDDGRFDAISSDYKGAKLEFKIALDEIRNPNLVGKPIPYADIEVIVRSLQTALWKKRRAIWGDKAPNDPVDVLNPAIAFQAIGYNFEEAQRPLGEIKTRRGLMEVAGMIDGSKRYAAISSQIPFSMRQFTAAHELGHALLHPPVGLHRDRGLDGSAISGPRERVEIEADKFAVLFLMPAKLLISEFEMRFGEGPFRIDDDTSFALISASHDALLKRVKGARDLSRIIVETEYYGGRRFQSLIERFGVSKETIAIRLEELNLIEF